MKLIDRKNLEAHGVATCKEGRSRAAECEWTIKMLALQGSCELFADAGAQAIEDYFHRCERRMSGKSIEKPS